MPARVEVPVAVKVAAERSVVVALPSMTRSPERVPPESERYLLERSGISEAVRFAFVIVTPERLLMALAAAMVFGEPPPRGGEAAALKAFVSTNRCRDAPSCASAMLNWDWVTKVDVSAGICSMMVRSTIVCARGAGAGADDWYWIASGCADVGLSGVGVCVATIADAVLDRGETCVSAA
jgi:hypothetical protein